MAKTAKTIRKNMLAIVTAATKVRDRVHLCSMDTLEHYKAHGDTTLMSEWINMLRESGQYRQALLDWFKKHGGVEVKRGGNHDGILLVKREGFDLSTIDTAKANDTPYFKKDTDENADLPKLDVYKALSGILKREAKAVANPDEFSEVKAFTPDDERVIRGVLERAGVEVPAQAAGPQALH